MTTFTSCISWIKNNPIKSLFAGLTILAGVVVSTVAPSVCLSSIGCNVTHVPSSSYNSTQRLILNFADISKTVRRIAPVSLWNYFEETGLPTSGIRVVSFANNDVLQEIRRLIEKELDLLNIVEDVPLITQPFGNVLDENVSMRRSLQVSPTSDPYFRKQWGLNTTNVQKAWNTTMGTSSVIVAVVDTGCDLNHPDLRDNLWKNVGEIPDNGIDDDGNGYVDDVFGYDFAGDCRTDWRASTGAQAKCGGKSQPQDTHSHGTHCAGIIAAINGNGIGVSGVAPRVQVMCLKVADPDGTFYTSHVLKAYDYALQMGAHIVSCSFGPAEPRLNPTPVQKEAMFNETRFYEQAILPMRKKNMLIISAAGNENTDLNSLPPNSTYNPCTAGRNVTLQPSMLCITATNPQDTRWAEILPNNQPAGSNYGTTVVDFGAPGREILSTVPPSIYANKTGSSMATPLTAGIAALVLSVLGSNNSQFYQGELTRRILLETVTHTPAMDGAVKYKGIVNAANAVQAALGQVSNVLTLFPVSIPKDAISMDSSFVETYFHGTVSNLEYQEWEALPLLDTSVRTGASLFSSYKYTSNVTLLINSTFVATISGLYRFQVSAYPSPENISLTIGFRRIELRSDTLTSVTLFAPQPGTYPFKVICINPSAPIAIMLSTPTNMDKLSSTSSNFVAYQTAPTPAYFAPNTKMSSVFQCLHSNVETVPVSLAKLRLNMNYQKSTVVEDIAFNTTGALGALFTTTQGVIGMFHARIRYPSYPVIFVLTCQACSLSINGLPVIDIYGTPTRSSGCVRMPTNSNTLHDVLVRFSIRPGTIDTSYMQLLWAPCANPQQLSSLKSSVYNSLFWRPGANRNIGVVGGMQCDIWPGTPALSSTTESAPSTSPFLKFRLPSAFASSKAITSVNVMNPLWYQYGCKANGTRMVEWLDRPCNASFNFFIRDVFNGFPLSPAQLLGQMFQNVYMRCWTYIPRGFADGVVGTRSTFPTYRVFIGAQTAFSIVPNNDEQFGQNGMSVAPAKTDLNGYYQLLTYEARNVGGTVLFGLLEGLTRSTFPVDYKTTILPIVGASQLQNQNKKRLTMSVYDPTNAYYDTQVGFGNFTVFNLNGSKVLSTASSETTGLFGRLSFGSTTSLRKGKSRYMRTSGYLQHAILSNVTLRVKAGALQTTMVTMGNVTIINGNEFPATVDTFDVQLTLPSGYVETDILIKSNSTWNEGVMSMEIIHPKNESGPLNGSYWFTESNPTK